MLLDPIHAVVVSDGYADYLEISLSHNRPLFGKCVVVTSPKDTKSQAIAGKHNCDLIVTEDGRRQDGSFNKGAMIERGLQQLPEGGWRIHFDSDIIFPGNMRTRLLPSLYCKKSIYGVDRMDIVGEKEWTKLLASGWATRGFEYHHFLNHSINDARIGSRLIYGDHGWVPIGFFQMWHSSAEYTDIYRTRTYPVGSSSAAHDDVQFSLRWDRRHRVLIPEILVAHLLTEDASYGKNWKGRITRPFGTGANPAANPAANTDDKNKGKSADGKTPEQTKSDELMNKLGGKYC